MSLSRQRKISKEMTRQINSRLAMIHDLLSFLIYEQAIDIENTYLLFNSLEKRKISHSRCLTRRKKQIPVIIIDIPNEY
jgi:hypothetical protein